MSFLLISMLILHLPLAGDVTIDSSDQARQTVTDYCKLDGDGALLMSNSAENAKIQRLLLNPDEVGWDALVVIKRFEIGGVTVRNDRATVHVSYDVVGDVYGDGTGISKPRTEKIAVSLIKKHGQWKIDHYMVPPHVFVKVVKREYPDAVHELFPGDAEP